MLTLVLLALLQADAVSQTTPEQFLAAYTHATLPPVSGNRLMFEDRLGSGTDGDPRWTVRRLTDQVLLLPVEVYAWSVPLVGKALPRLRARVKPLAGLPVNVVMTNGQVVADTLQLEEGIVDVTCRADQSYVPARHHLRFYEAHLWLRGVKDQLSRPRERVLLRVRRGATRVASAATRRARWKRCGPAVQ